MASTMDEVKSIVGQTCDALKFLINHAQKSISYGLTNVILEQYKYIVAESKEIYNWVNGYKNGNFLNELSRKYGLINISEKQYIAFVTADISARQVAYRDMDDQVKGRGNYDFNTHLNSLFLALIQRI